MVTGRRKGTGKEQTFLAYKTLLQFSWPAFTKGQPKLVHEVEVGVTATGATRGSILWPLTAPLDLRRTNNSLIDYRY